ncbi:MAG: thermonuclease family protein [Candidatus Omnitrophica bacterium]|nr:thermonuclease family protein [Candidatus Omnitrophota bacterium]
MAKTLSNTSYRNLRDEISAIYTDSKQQAARALDRVLNKAHWEIGKRIVTVEQKNAIRAQYGDRLLKHLSEDLTEIHGNGFSITNLKYMRQFFLTNPKGQPADQLGWTKQCVLLSIKDEKVRKQYERKAVAENWSKSALIDELKKDKVKRERDQESLAPAQPLSADKKPARKRLSLQYVRGRTGFYRAVEIEGLHMPKKRCALDLGFNVYKKDIEGIARRAHGDIVVAAGEASVRAASGADKKDLYTYKAYVDRVIDGDTVWVDVELGFGVFIRQKLRLRGIDAPEVDTKRGKTAKGFLRRTLQSVEYIVIKTHGSDKYGRYLADIFYLPGEPGAAEVAAEGIYLNQEMLDHGLAGLYLAEG